MDVRLARLDPPQTTPCAACDEFPARAVAIRYRPAMPEQPLCFRCACELETKIHKMLREAYGE